ncbi:MAG TPA: ferritin-like domain-containing protein [Gemmatimonadales bacterium]|jgi:ferritin-like metal-binding protein YciE
MALATMQDLFIEQLKDLYSAEKQLVQALPKMAKAATTPELVRAITDHLDQTQNHVSRLEQCFEHLNASSRGKRCKGMEGLIEEGKETIEEAGEAVVKDAGLIAAAQRVEHYEISGYGTAKTMASLLGLDDVADLLEETLGEEEEADKLLSQIAMDQVNPQALSVGNGGRVKQEDESEDEDESEEMESRSRSSKASQRRR